MNQHYSCSHIYTKNPYKRSFRKEAHRNIRLNMFIVRSEKRTNVKDSSEDSTILSDQADNSDHLFVLDSLEII